MTALGLDSRPRLERRHRLQWEPAQGAYVLLYPEGMVKLNGSAGEILKRCDGRATLADITDELETVFAATGLEKDVRAFLTGALANNWVEVGP